MDLESSLTFEFAFEKQTAYISFPHREISPNEIGILKNFYFRNPFSYRFCNKPQKNNAMNIYSQS